MHISAPRVSDYAAVCNSAMTPLLNSSFHVPVASGNIHSSRLTALAPAPLSTSLEFSLSNSASPTYAALDSLLTKRQSQLDVSTMRTAVQDEERMHIALRERSDAQLRLERDRAAEVAREVEAERQHRAEALYERIMEKERELDSWRLERQRQADEERLQHLQEAERAMEMKFQRELARLKAEGLNHSLSDSIVVTLERVQKEIRDREERLTSALKRRESELLTKLEDIELQRIREAAEIKDVERQGQSQLQQAVEKFHNLAEDLRRDLQQSVRQHPQSPSAETSDSISPSAMQQLRDAYEEEKRTLQRTLDLKLETVRSEHQKQLAHNEDNRREELRDVTRKHEQSVEALRQALNRESEALSRLRDDMDKKTEENRALRSEKLLLERQINDLQSHIDRSMTDRTNADSTAAFRVERDEAVTLARTTRLEFEASQRQWQAERDDLNRKIEEFRAAEKISDSKVRSAAADLEILRNQTAQSLDEQRRRYEQDVARYKSQLEEQSAAMTRLARKEAETREELDALRTQLHRTDQEKSAAQLEASLKSVEAHVIPDLRKEVETLRQQITALQERERVSEASARSFQDEIARYKKNLTAQLTQQNEFLSERDQTISLLTRQLQEERQQLAVQRNSFEMEHSTTTQALASKETECAQLKLTLKRLEQELSTARRSANQNVTRATSDAAISTDVVKASVTVINAVDSQSSHANGTQQDVPPSEIPNLQRSMKADNPSSERKQSLQSPLLPNLLLSEQPPPPGATPPSKNQPHWEQPPATPPSEQPPPPSVPPPELRSATPPSYEVRLSEQPSPPTGPPPVDQLPPPSETPPPPFEQPLTSASSVPLSNQHSSPEHPKVSQPSEQPPPPSIPPPYSAPSFIEEPSLPPPPPQAPPPPSLELTTTSGIHPPHNSENAWSPARFNPPPQQDYPTPASHKSTLPPMSGHSPPHHLPPASRDTSPIRSSHTSPPEGATGNVMTDSLPTVPRQITVTDAAKEKRHKKEKKEHRRSPSAERDTKDKSGRKSKKEKHDKSA